MTRIVVPDDFPATYGGAPEELQPLRERGEVIVFDTLPSDAGELYQRLEGAEVAINIRAYTKFDEPLFEALPELKLVAILGTGTDNVDLESATRHGVVVSNAPGASTDSVAETAFALMMAVARHVPRSDRELREGHWRHHMGVELQGKTAGIIGMGLIGQAMARMCSGFGMKVLAWSYTHDEQRAAACGARAVGFEQLLREADVVSLHLRNTERSRGIIGAEQLAQMKPGAILVNTARGALVDEEALAEALLAGRLFGAGLDVYSTEPLPADSPLRKPENVVLLPHVGWVTDEASLRLMRMPVQNVLAYLDGAPRHVVNPEVLEGAWGKR